MSPFPSIEALARYERGVQARDVVIQDRESGLAPNSPEMATHERASRLAFHRTEALSNLILALPATTMADVIAQVGYAMGEVETLDNRVRDSLDWKGRLDLDNLARAFASILHVMAGVSDVPAAELVEGWCLDQHKAWFGILDAAQ